LKSICGDCKFQTQIMCARLAALFIDKVLIHTSNNLLVRNMIDTDTDEAMDNKREDLLDKLMFKHYRKAPRSVSRTPDSESAEPISAISLKKLMTNHGSLFHEYSRLVMKWDHDNTNTDEFSLCTPFRGRLLDDEHYDESYLTKCLDWLRDTIADKQLATFEAILDFLEHTCRFKNAKAGVCLVLYSVAKGTGKSVFMDMIESVVGGYNAAIESGSISRTVGDRNAHIIGKKVALIDELKTCSASSKQEIEKFKTMITQPKNACTPLYSKTIKIDNRLNFVLTTNNLNGLYVPNATGEIRDSLRRFNFIKVGSNRQQDKAFYDPFVKYIKTQKFADHMYSFLHRRSKLANDRPLDCIITELTHEISDSQAQSVPLFWSEFKTNYYDWGIQLVDTDDELVKRVNKKDAYSAYKRIFCLEYGYSDDRKTQNKFSAESNMLNFVESQRSNGQSYFVINL
jgi:uncharacterized protein YifN (PemK superfamily)